MGLAERRAAKDYENNRYVSLLKEIHAAATFDVPITVRWETLAVDGYAHLYDEAWTKVYFRPLIDALKSITRDQLGIDAVRSTLKSIVIENRTGNTNSDAMATLSDGVLTLDHEPCANIDYEESRTAAISKYLESKL